MADTVAKNKTFMILVRDHILLEQNLNSKDSYRNPDTIVFVHNNKEKAIIEFNRLISEHTNSDHRIEHRADLCIDIYSIKKLSGWTGKYRENRLIKSISLLDYTFP